MSGGWHFRRSILPYVTGEKKLGGWSLPHLVRSAAFDQNRAQNSPNQGHLGPQEGHRWQDGKFRDPPACQSDRSENSLKGTLCISAVELHSTRVLRLCQTMVEVAEQTVAPARKRQRQQDLPSLKGGIQALQQQSKGGSKHSPNKRRRASKTAEAAPHTDIEGAAVAAHTPASKLATKKRAPLHVEQRHMHTGAVATGLGARAATTPGRTAKGWATCCC